MENSLMIYLSTNSCGAVVRRPFGVPHHPDNTTSLPSVASHYISRCRMQVISKVSYRSSSNNIDSSNALVEDVVAFSKFIHILDRLLPICVRVNVWNKAMKALPLFRTTVKETLSKKEDGNDHSLAHVKRSEGGTFGWWAARYNPTTPRSRDGSLCSTIGQFFCQDGHLYNPNSQSSKSPTSKSPTTVLITPRDYPDCSRQSRQSKYRISHEYIVPPILKAIYKTIRNFYKPFGLFTDRNKGYIRKEGGVRYEKKDSL